MAGGSPLHVGTRHPVLLIDGAASAKPASGGDIGVLLTSGAVLHGTPTAPCVAAWEAGSLSRVSPAVSAIISGDLAHAFAFRAAGDAGAAAGAGRPGRPAEPARPGAEPAALEYRAMTCRFDPSAKVPDAVFSEPGTIRTER
jgi:hypothetical protein